MPHFAGFFATLILDPQTETLYLFSLNQAESGLLAKEGFGGEDGLLSSLVERAKKKTPPVIVGN